MVTLARRFAYVFWLTLFAGAIQPAIAQQYGNGALFLDDGETIIFHSFSEGDGNLVEFNLRTGATRRITEKGRSDRWPSVDPTGQHLAFISQRTPPWKVYTISRNGGDLRLLTEEEGTHLGVSWSPDGTQLAYSKQDLDAESFRADLWLMNVNGTDKTKVIEGAMWPFWDKHSNTVFFTTVLTSGNVAVGSYDLDTKVRDTLTDGTLNAAGAGISPDGKYIYVSAVAGAKHTLHRINRDGEGVVNLGIASQQDSSPRVSPDGRFLLYGYNAGQGTEVYLLDLETKQVRNLSKDVAAAQ